MFQWQNGGLTDTNSFLELASVRGWFVDGQGLIQLIGER